MEGSGIIPSATAQLAVRSCMANGDHSQIVKWSLQRVCCNARTLQCDGGEGCEACAPTNVTQCSVCNEDMGYVLDDTTKKCTPKCKVGAGPSLAMGRCSR